MGELKPMDLFNVPLSGISLVEASAGTGKTYNIASLYVRAILELGLEPSQILVMTFTEAATAELKSRLRDRIRDSLSVIRGDMEPKDEFFESMMTAGYKHPQTKLKNALDSFDEASVFTIHGFCNRLLTEYSVQFDVPTNVELLTNPDELLQDCVDEYWLEFNREAEKDSVQWLALKYLIGVGFGPDELKQVADQVLDETNARIVPELQLNDLEPELNELKEVYLIAKEQWVDENHKLKEILYSGHLHGGKFKNDKLDDYWEAITSWIERSEFTFEYPPALSKFSLYLYKSLNKSAPDYEVLSICRSIDRFIELVEGLSKIKVAFINESMGVIKDRFKALKRSRQVLSYDDMLTTVEEGLASKASISLKKRLSEKYPFALVDEFQDTDQIQYNILKSIYYKRKDTGLFMIGDPKQAIYSFRGADVYTYLEAKSDLTNEQAYGLTENYRSNRGMIEGINQLFSGPQHSFIDQEIRFQQAKFPEEKEDVNYIYDAQGNLINPLQFIELNETNYTSKSQLNEDIFSALTREILELLTGDYKIRIGDSEDLEAVKEKHIAILVWKGADGEKIQDVLREVGIKSVLRSNTSVFSTEISVDLFRVLNAIQNLSHEPGVRAALVSSLIGYDAMDLKDLEENEERWAKIIADLTQIKDEWNKHGIERALNLFIDHFRVFETLSDLQNAERMISNLSHLSELLSKESRENRFNPNALIRWYYSKINDESANLKAKDEEQLRLESDEELVQISTMHSSKGLQYPIVFCPFLWSSKVISNNEDILKLKKNGTTFIDLSGDLDHKDKNELVQLAKDQNKAEDVRLAYVSLTRSISACYVFLPDYNKIHNSPISYILNGKDISDSIDFHSLKSDLDVKETIKIRKPVRDLIPYKKDEKPENKTLKAKTLKRKDLFKYPRLLSYSTLVGDHGEPSSGKDYDGIWMDATGYEEKISKLKNRFSFPRGANAGSFLHQIFEDLSFQDPDNLASLINENLSRFGFEEHWKEPVKDWLERSLHHNLGKPNTSLSELRDGHVIKEMEFYFPVDQLEISEIWRHIRLKHSDNKNHESYDGYLKGYIDLVFEWHGKYYILDYKSNHLGDQLGDYNNEALNNAIMDAGYDLQYHLYTIALDRYLSSSIVDYNYEKNFGGVLYLFLRGIDSSKPGSGVFFDRPEGQLIQTLNEVVK